MKNFELLRRQWRKFEECCDDHSGGKDEGLKIYRVVARGGGDGTNGPVWMSPADDPDKHLTPQDILDLNLDSDTVLACTQIWEENGVRWVQTKPLWLTQPGGKITGTMNDYDLAFEAATLSDPFATEGKRKFTTESLKPTVPVILLSCLDYVHPYTSEPLTTDAESSLKNLTPNDILDMGLREGSPMLFRTRFGVESGTLFTQYLCTGQARSDDTGKSLSIYNKNYYAESMDAPYRRNN